MVDPNVTRVEDTAEEVMQITKAELERYGLEVPEKSYLTFGSEDMIAHDYCSQLTVGPSTSRYGLPNPDTPTTIRLNTCGKGFIVDMIVQIVRCSPKHQNRDSSSGGSVRSSNLNPKMSMDDLDAYARERMHDMFVLHRVADAINERASSLGTAINYSITVGPDSGGSQAVTLIMPVNV